MVAIQSGLLIGGEWSSGTRRFEVVDPANLNVITTVADATGADAIDAVAAAAEAFTTWSQAAPRFRAEVLQRAFQIMTSEGAFAAELISRENGKALRDARREVTYAAEFFRWFAEEAVRVPGDFRRAPAGDKTIVVDSRPIGVAYLITPWNFPAAMATRKIAPALAAGCTCVLKPASETPLTALWLGDVLQRAGAPAGVVNIVPTTAPGPVTTTVFADPRVATLSFTGSTHVGKLLLHQAADRVLRTSMELGGNAPFLVVEGADLDLAVDAAMVAKMRNGGSACTAANRFYVHDSLVTAFADAMEKAFEQLVIGPGTQETTDLGAMVSLHERDKVQALVDGAADDGARVSPAQPLPDAGAFISPHVVRDVEHGSTLTKAEIFGPVAPIVSFTAVEEAVRMANDSEFGLISYVIAPDSGTGLGIARQLDAGMVAVNRGVASDPAAPFGGTKESGLGREGGFAGIHEFLETQYFAVDF